MKRTLPVLSFLLFALSLSTFSQISLLSTDMPAVGDTLITATDNNAVGLTIGNAGINQTWNFGTAVPDRYDTNYIVSPASTPYSANFPTANRSGTQNFVDYIFTRVSGQKYEVVGATIGIFGTPTPVPYSPTDELYRFPTTYNNKYSSNYGYQIITPFSSLPPNIQAQIDSGLPNGVTVTEFRTTNTVNFTDTIDGWGTTITPVCSYHSLRQKRKETSHFTIEAHTYFFGFPTGWTSVLDSTSTTTNYNWLAKETKLALVTANRVNGTSITNITYSLLPPALTADFSSAGQSACPGASVSFTDKSEGCPDSWLWTFTGATPSTSVVQNPSGIVYSATGAYSVTLQVTRNGKTSTKTVPAFITVNPNPTANAGPDAEICLGKTATLTASGGTSYSWSSGASSANAPVSPTVTTTYTVTVLNSFGCSASDNADVIVDPLPPADAGVNDTVCYGNSGSLTASGGVSYAWSNGGSTFNLTATPFTTTLYTVTVTDVKGCSATDNASIEVLSLPPADAGVNDSVCYGETGTLTASGGVAYQWSTSETTASISHTPLTRTLYSVTVTGANGCSASDNASIVVNALPVVSVPDVTICTGSTGTLNAGNPGASYLWSTNETTQTISVSSAAVYSVTVTNINNCTAADNAQVFENPVPVADAGENDTVCYGKTGSLTAAGGTSYAWSNGANSANLNASPLLSTLYTVTVTDSNGCTASDNAMIDVLSLPLADAGVNDTICNGETGTLTATGGVAYLWSSGEITDFVSASPSITTSYAVTVTDVNGCSASDNASIAVNPVPSKELNDITLCFGSVSVLDAGNAGDSFAWSTGNTNQTISVNTADTYSVTVTNSFNCSNADTSVVTISTNLAVNLTDHVICQGDLLILNSGNPGITHQWSTGDTTQTISVISSGTYSVTVVDGVGCTGGDTSVVQVNPLPVASAGVNDTICFGSSGLLTATGGISYAWSSGDLTASITKSPSLLTSYTVTVTDANGCSATDNASIEVNLLPTKQLSDLEICFSTSGTLDAGNAGASFAWSTGDNSQSVSVNVAGNYSVTITDVNGCVNSDTSLVTVRSQIVIGLTNQQTCQGNSVTLDAGNAGLAHLWSTNDNTQTITVLAGGTYTVTITDGANCTAQSSSIVTVNSNPVVDAGSNQSICDGASAQLTGTGSGTFLWSTGETTNSISVSPSQTQTYHLQVTDANNCIGHDSVTVTVNTLPSVSILANDTICAGESGALTATGNGTFLWNTGETTASISHSPGSNTSYSVQLTDANNCTASAAANIFVNQLPLVDAGVNATTCAGGSVTLNASGGVQYTWSSGQTTSSFTFSPSSSDKLYVTAADANGCQNSDSVTVTVFPLPQVSIVGLSSGYCPNVRPVTLNGTPQGGTFSGLGVSGNMFLPTIVPAGVWDITYTYTDANNCTATDTQHVEVYTESLVNFASLSPSYCANAPKDTLAITPPGGTLSGPGITGNVFNPAAAGAGGPYPISYSRIDTFGCAYMDTAYVTVIALPALMVGVDTLYCNDASPVVISVNPAGGILKIDGVVDSVFNPTFAGIGTHNVIYTYSSGCGNSDTVKVRVKVCTGVDDISELKNVKIYPNPTASELFIDCDEIHDDKTQITLIDVVGKEIYFSCCKSRFEIDVQSLPSGTYIIRIQSEGKTTARKVIVSGN